MPQGSTHWATGLRGRFIVFDGPDGSGKSTQFRRFAEFAHEHGVEVCEVREPGGTNIGEQIRQILLSHHDEDMDMICEMLLYMASRAQLVEQRVRPEMEAGRLVLADRFISSTLAYQGAAGGVAEEAIRQVGAIALRDCWPDLVVVFDVDEATAASRLNPLLDRIEARGAAYHRRVREGYHQQAQRDPQHHRLIDARDDPDTVFHRLLETMQQWLSHP